MWHAEQAWPGRPGGPYAQAESPRSYVFERQSSPGVTGRLLPVERGPGRSTPRATAPLVHLRQGRLSKQDVEGLGWGPAAALSATGGSH